MKRRKRDMLDTINWHFMYQIKSKAPAVNTCKHLEYSKTFSIHI